MKKGVSLIVIGLISFCALSGWIYADGHDLYSMSNHDVASIGNIPFSPPDGVITQYFKQLTLPSYATNPQQVTINETSPSRTSTPPQTEKSMNQAKTTQSVTKMTTTAKTFTTKKTSTTTSSPTTTTKYSLTPPSGSISMSSEEKRILELVNNARIAEGASPLQHDGTLTWLARLKSQDMVDLKYFSHNSPIYGSPYDMLKAAGVSYRLAGENLASCGSPDRAFTLWMDSDGHRKNILNPSYTHTGIGAANSGASRFIFTQLFIKR